MQVPNGFFLALEGIDGAGTTTQAARVASYLSERGYPVHTTAEPSAGPVGVLTRAALQSGELDDDTLALLFAADRIDHLRREIEPALGKGAIVISDRYLLSSLAYQASTLPLAWVQAINARARRPDASVLLRVDAEVAAARRTQRGGPRERFDDLTSQRQIALAYDAVFALPDVGNTYVVAGGEDIDDVTATLLALVDRLLAGRNAGQTREIP